MPETTREIVKATVVLHNLLQKQTTVSQTATILNDFDERRANGIRPLQRIGLRGSNPATAVRDNFKDYIVNYNVLPWQEARVRGGFFGDQ